MRMHLLSFLSLMTMSGLFAFISLSISSSSSSYYYDYYYYCCFFFDILLYSLMKLSSYFELRAFMRVQWLFDE